jgi:hypothetical protein
MAGAVGQFGCCIVTVLASHLFSATGYWVEWNQLLMVSNMMNLLCTWKDEIQCNTAGAVG